MPRCLVKSRSLGLQLFHQRIGLAAIRDVGFVPDGQYGGHDRPRVLQHFLEIQPIDAAHFFDQIHIQVNGVVIATAQFQVGKRIALWQFEGQKGIGLHGACGEKLLQRGLIVANSGASSKEKSGHKARFGFR